MKKIVIGGVAALALGALVVRLLPDIKRYVRIRCM
ncbi:DUF6893 family small protein [Streptomyces sp. NBC_01217]